MSLNSREDMIDQTIGSIQIGQMFEIANKKQTQRPLSCCAGHALRNFRSKRNLSDRRLQSKFSDCPAVSLRENHDRLNLPNDPALEPLPGEQIKNGHDSSLCKRRSHEFTSRFCSWLMLNEDPRR